MNENAFEYHRGESQGFRGGGNDLLNMVALRLSSFPAYFTHHLFVFSTIPYDSSLQYAAAT